MLVCRRNLFLSKYFLKMTLVSLKLINGQNQILNFHTNAIQLLYKKNFISKKKINTNFFSKNSN
jgi:hypothetical protein